jgi:hypothetical protein
MQIYRCGQRNRQQLDRKTDKLNKNIERGNTHSAPKVKPVTI